MQPLLPLCHYYHLRIATISGAKKKQEPGSTLNKGILVHNYEGIRLSFLDFAVALVLLNVFEGLQLILSVHVCC